MKKIYLKLIKINNSLNYENNEEYKNLWKIFQFSFNRIYNESILFWAENYSLYYGNSS